jgi:ABC-type Fe3+-citrate transport system substrate-binding protein
MSISTSFLIPLVVGLIILLLTVLVNSARKKNKEEKLRKAFNPIEVKDEKGNLRYFTWHSRDPVHLIEVEHQDKQLLGFFKTLCEELRKNSEMEPQFNHSYEIMGEIVYELSSDYRAKWRLLGGQGGTPGRQILVLVPRLH